MLHYVTLRFLITFFLPQLSVLLLLLSVYYPYYKNCDILNILVVVFILTPLLLPTLFARTFFYPLHSFPPFILNFYYLFHAYFQICSVFIYFLLLFIRFHSLLPSSLHFTSSHDAAILANKMPNTFMRTNKFTCNGMRFFIAFSKCCFFGHKFQNINICKSSLKCLTKLQCIKKKMALKCPLKDEPSF